MRVFMNMFETQARRYNKTKPVLRRQKGLYTETVLEGPRRYGHRRSYEQWNVTFSQPSYQNHRAVLRKKKWRKLQRTFLLKGVPFLLILFEVLMHNLDEIYRNLEWQVTE